MSTIRAQISASTIPAIIGVILSKQIPVLKAAVPNMVLIHSSAFGRPMPSHGAWIALYISSISCPSFSTNSAP